MLIYIKQNFTRTFGRGFRRSCALLCVPRGKWGCAPHQDGVKFWKLHLKNQHMLRLWVAICKALVASAIVSFGSLQHGGVS